MVLVGRGWSAEAGRAARDRRAFYTRLLFLSGIVAVAWLAGGIGVAHGDTASESDRLAGSVADLGATAEDAGRTAAEETRTSRLSETADRVAESTESLTEEIAPQAAALPAEALEGTGVSTVLDGTTTGDTAGRVVDEASQAVEETTRGAGGLVAGVTRTGQEVAEGTDDSLRETGLVDAIADGLSESTRVIDHRLDGAVATAVTADPRAGDDRASSDASDPAREDQETDEAAGTSRVKGPVSEGSLWQEASEWRAVAAEASEQVVSAEDGDLGERIRLLGSGAHNPVGADTTGASAPSFSGSGAAGFLVARADHLAPPIQRVALPGDPALVVRDAADDPSYSPD